MITCDKHSQILALPLSCRAPGSSSCCTGPSLGEQELSLLGSSSLQHVFGGQQLREDMIDIAVSKCTSAPQLPYPLLLLLARLALSRVAGSVLRSGPPVYFWTVGCLLLLHKESEVIAARHSGQH